MVSGLGIKNKLLEAAAMARPILCTSKATLGLELPRSLPFVVADRPAEWAETLVALWDDPERRRQLGVEARQWVANRHSWAAAADLALRGVGSSATASAHR
jgi:glycosyltransferase involved in cell wall biosynthesis